jgi:putative peptidoglycan lipid II flippase
VSTRAEKIAIAQRAGVVAGGTLLSRVLGAARDSVIAASFHVAATDAFFVAFTIPNALRVLLGEGAVSSAFVPVFSEVTQREGETRARRFLSNLSGVMITILAGVTVVGVLGASWIVPLYAAGYGNEPGKLELTTDLTRLVFPYIFFMGLAALGMGALNARKRFFVPAFAPALLNVAMIAAPWLLVPLTDSLYWPPIAALAASVLIGGLLQVVAQVPALRAEGLMVVPRFGLSDPYVRKSLRLISPLLFGLGIYQLNVMLSRLFASFLPTGAQSYLYYGQRLVELPQGMFAMAIASAALPSLSELRGEGKNREAKEVVEFALRMALFVAIPSSLALMAVAEPTVVMLFGRGSFTLRDVEETARSLTAQAAGIWAVASVRTLVPAFHAYNDTKTPVISSAVNLVTFVGLSLALMPAFAHVGIAAAISVAAVAQLTVLVLRLRRHLGGLSGATLLPGVGRVIVASLVMATVARSVCVLGVWERGGNDLRNLLVYLGALVASAASLVGVAYVLRMPELVQLTSMVRRRIRR